MLGKFSDSDHDLWDQAPGLGNQVGDLGHFCVSSLQGIGINSSYLMRQLFMKMKRVNAHHGLRRVPGTRYHQH